MKLEHWVLLILVFLVGVLVPLSLPEGKPAASDPQAQEQGQESQRGIQSTKPAADNGNTNTDQGRLHILPMSFQAVFAGALVLFAILQILLMQKQNKLVDRQNEVMNRQTELMDKQTNAMDSQTTHMESGLRAAQTSLLSQWFE